MYFVGLLLSLMFPEWVLVLDNSEPETKPFRDMFAEI